MLLAVGFLPNWILWVVHGSGWVVCCGRDRRGGLLGMLVDALLTYWKGGRKEGRGVKIRSTDVSTVRTSTHGRICHPSFCVK